MLIVNACALARIRSALSSHVKRRCWIVSLAAVPSRCLNAASFASPTTASTKLPGASGSNNQASGQVAGATDTVWNKPVYVTSAIGAGTAVVGTRSSAQVWRRGGLSVEASNSHSNYFQLNLVAIRAEERLGLAVYRPTGFVEVRLS